MRSGSLARMRRDLLLVVGIFVAPFALSSVTACNLLDKKLGKDAGATASADDGGAPTTKAANGAPGAEGAHVVEGIGAIVPWAPDQRTGSAKCAPSAAATARFKAIEKGDD